MLPSPRPEGAELTANIDGDMPLDMAKIDAPVAAQEQPAPSTLTSTELTFTSNPDGADIEVDDEFAGCTPHIMAVKAGDHTIRVGKEGYTSFEKKLHTDGGRISIEAELNKDPHYDERPEPRTFLAH